MDTLHCLLRVGGKLLKLFIGTHVITPAARDALCAEFRRINIKHFRFWTSEAGTLQWTSLNGDLTYLMLRELNLTAIDAGASTIQALWRRFLVLYTTVKYGFGHADACASNYTQLQEALSSWLADFLGHVAVRAEGLSVVAESVGGGGYALADITPYLHLFVDHSVELMIENGPLGQYSCQGIEQMNHLHKKQFFGATSRSGGRGKRKSSGEQLLDYNLRQQCYRDEVPFPSKKLKVVHSCSCGKEFTYRKALTTHQNKGLCA